MFQECTLLVLDLLSFLGHLALVFQRTFNQRSNPLLDDIPVLLGSITERFKEGPEPTSDAPLKRNLLDFHKRIHKAIESVSTVRQSVKVVSEEELGCGINGETSNQVFEVDGLVSVEIGDVVESPIDVFIKEPKIGCPVVGEERTCDRAMLPDNQEPAGREVILVCCLPSSTFRRPGSRFPSQGKSP